MNIEFQNLKLKELKKKLIQYQFMVSDFENISLRMQDVQEIKKYYASQVNRIEELIELKQQEIKLKRWKKNLEWFGIVAVVTGISFFVSDYQIWKYFNFGFIRKIFYLLLNSPGWVKSIFMSLLTVASFSLMYRQKKEVNAKGLLILSLIILAYTIFSIPVWLFHQDMVRSSLCVFSFITLCVSYQKSFKTLMYVGLFGLLNWLGGATGYGMGCYWLYMKDPLLFLPIGGLFICIGHWVGRYGKAYLKQPFEVVGCITLFNALLILSIWGYNFDHEWVWSKGPDISPIWFIVLMTGICIFFMWLGIRQERRLFFNFGVVFLVIDLYTRFFEVFSEWLPRSLFWLIFGSSLSILSILVRKKLFKMKNHFRAK